MEQHNELMELQPKYINTAGCSVNKSTNTCDSKSCENTTDNYNVCSLSVLPYSMSHDSNVFGVNKMYTINDSKNDQLQRNHFDDFDRSNLNDIDPDKNYIDEINSLMVSNYHDENSFNVKYGGNKSFSVFLLNLRSLPDHFRELTSYLDCLNVEFKIIALTETWLKEHHTNYTLPNYVFEQEYRSRLRGGGVCLYIHHSLTYKLRDDLKLIPREIATHKSAKSADKEINSIFVEIDKYSTSTKRNIIVGCIYRPPSSSMGEFNELLRNLFDKLERENKLLYITADFNCNTLLNNITTDEFTNIFSSNHLYPLINRPTRVTKNSSTLIDNIYCNIPNLSNCVEAGLLHVNISDHKGLFCFIIRQNLLTKKNKSIETIYIQQRIRHI